MSIEVLKYKEINKGAMLCSLSVFVEKMGIEINDIIIFQKNGRRWANMPSRQYEKDGETKYFPYLRFRERDHQNAFSDQVVRAMEDYCMKQASIQQEPPIPQQPEEEVPF